MHLSKLFMVVGLVILFPLYAEAQPVAEGNAVFVEASGKVPGFTQTQLNEYLAQKMREENGPLTFVAGNPESASAPNRLVWKFKMLRKVWNGGSHNGFPTQAHSVFYLSAEVKLYLQGEYQLTMNAHPSVIDGDDDHTLAEMVKYVTHAMFVESNPEKQGGIKLK